VQFPGRLASDRGMRRLAATAALAATMLVAPAAHAAFPGANGRIAYSFNSPNEFEQSMVYTERPDGTQKSQLSSSPLFFTDSVSWSPDGRKVAYDDGSTAIYTINADGTAETMIDFSGYDEYGPAWSPDGTKIVFQSNRGNCGPSVCDLELWTMNPDGSGQTQITDNTTFDGAPAWSPDGTRIAFESDGGIWLMNADGTNRSFLVAGQRPNWSPDGSKIAFSRIGALSKEIFVVNAAGTNEAQLTNDTVSDTDPAWSPDGSKIAWVRDRDLYTMNPDGTGSVQVGARSFGEEYQTAPDWQPLPAAGYPRPKGATPAFFSLVPAYANCAGPNRAHGAPLSFGACAPPALQSSQLTVGTPDANGQAAKSIAYLDIATVVGNPATPADEADVNLLLSAKDVRNRGDLSDYAGALEARPTLRITDRDNTPHPGGPGPATVSDTTLPFSVPCAPTGDAAVGSTCAVATSVEALVAGAVKEGRRAVWELAQVVVNDGSGAPFLRQGVFVP
jgi:WD40-like Beta Propeller Repeat